MDQRARTLKSKHHPGAHEPPSSFREQLPAEYEEHSGVLAEHVTNVYGRKPPGPDWPSVSNGIALGEFFPASTSDAAGQFLPLPLAAALAQHETKGKGKHKGKGKGKGRKHKPTKAHRAAAKKHKQNAAEVRRAKLTEIAQKALEEREREDTPLVAQPPPPRGPSALAQYPLDPTGAWHRCTIEAVREDGTFDVIYEVQSPQGSCSCSSPGFLFFLPQDLRLF